MNGMLAGAIAGILATAPMTVAMSRLFRELPLRDRHPLPPRLLTERILGPCGMLDGVQESRRIDVALLAHFGYGGATGALYPSFARRLGGSPLVAGPVYGAAVWAASYLGWIPVAGLLTPATRHSGRRNALMIAAHVVWGAGTAILSEGIRRPAGFGTSGGAVVPVPPEAPEIPRRHGPQISGGRESGRWSPMLMLGAAATVGGILAWSRSRSRRRL